MVLIYSINVRSFTFYNKSVNEIFLVQPDCESYLVSIGDVVFVVQFCGNSVLLIW